jgi:hypothetical protein
VLEMLGEFLREVAVLVLVFVPLEVWKGAGATPQQLTVVLILTAVLAIASLIAGISLERIRT